MAASPEEFENKEGIAGETEHGQFPEEADQQ